MIGLSLLIASGGSTLIHRKIYEAARDGPAQVAELAIGLLTFCLASAGILLVIHGSRLFKQTESPGTPMSGSRTWKPPAGGRLLEADELESREGVALLLARKAIAAAAENHGAATAKPAEFAPRDGV